MSRLLARGTLPGAEELSSAGLERSGRDGEGRRRSLYLQRRGNRSGDADSRTAGSGSRAIADRWNTGAYGFRKRRSHGRGPSLTPALSVQRERAGVRAAYRRGLQVTVVLGAAYWCSCDYSTANARECTRIRLQPHESNPRLCRSIRVHWRPFAVREQLPGTHDGESLPIRVAAPSRLHDQRPLVLRDPVLAAVQMPSRIVIRDGDGRALDRSPRPWGPVGFANPKLKASPASRWPVVQNPDDDQLQPLVRREGQSAGRPLRNRTRRWPCLRSWRSPP